MGFINDNESELSESSDTITICRNCHLPGHKRKNCPRDGECERCYQRTHSIDKCPYNTPEFADVTFIPVPYNAPGTLARNYYPQPAPIERKSFEDIPSDLGELEAWQPYDGDDVEIIPFERPGFIPHIAAQVLEYPVKPSVLLNHDVVFPDLHDLLASLIGGLRDERWKHLTVMPYYGMIEMFGGKEEVIRCAFESIPPEITALQGKVVTVKQLDTIRAIQGAAESWPRETGYLDYVTDLRNGEYYRPYVDQSSDAAVRIHQHLTALEKDRRNTLHYYFVSEGRQYREMNYIRLWSLPLQVTSDLNAKESRLLLNNILEFIMCRAFQSLQPSELDPFFGKGNYMTTGLNILPPFLQGISLSVATRAKYISKCLGSADEQIRMWPSERKKQHDSSRIAPARHEKHRPYRYWCGSQYHDALARAIRDTENCEDLVWSGDDNLQCPHTVDFTELQQKAGIFAHYPYPQPPLVRPFGSPEARVGVILDTCPVNKAGNSHNIEQNITALPAALIEANFTELNSLVWTNDLRQCFQSGSNSSRQTVSYQDDNLKAFHRALIETSNLRVILLGGRKAERMIIREELLENKTVLHLLDCSLVAYLETNKEKTEVQRIYVRLTASLGITSHCASWEETKEHSEALKFAAEISETPSIHGFSIVSKLVGKEIILRHWLEREKKLELMTMSTMPSSIREWFALKGITSDQHIELFERLGGSLARGAFLLLCTLPKSGWTHERSILKREFSTTPNAVGFGKEVLQKSKELYSQLTGYDYAAASTTDVTVDNGPASNRRSVYPVPSFTSEELETLFEESRNHDTKTEELNAADTNSRDTSLFNPPEKPAYKLAAQEDEERESLLRGKFFSGHVYKKLGSHYQIWALKHMLTVRFSHDNVDLSEGFILQVLMSPPGTRHPHVYATQTLESDPAARIAVKITGVQTDGTEFCLYARQQVEAWKEPMRLNAVFDWFTGLSIEQIALRNSPRRYIYISNRDFIKSGSESLAGFVRGGFTEGSLSSQEAEWWEIEKAKNARLKRGKV